MQVYILQCIVVNHVYIIKAYHNGVAIRGKDYYYYETSECLNVLQKRSKLASGGHHVQGETL